MANKNFPPSSFEDALYHFEHLEKRLDLASWRIHGIYVWKLIRFPLFRQYRLFHGIGETAHPESQRLRKSKVQLIKKFQTQLIFRNPFFFSNSEARRVVIPHPRKRLYEGKLVDPISFRAWADSQANDSLILDRTSPLDPTSLPNAPDNDVMVRLGWIIGQLMSFRLSQNDVERINAIQRALSDDLKIDGLNLQQFLVKNAKAFKGQVIAYKAFFRFIKPKGIYLVISYGCEAPIAAAQELGIPTAEFQHGSMDRGHLGYDFADWDSVPYFPDHLLAWGEAWFSECALPRHCKTHLVGAPHLVSAICEAQNLIKRQERSLLVLSQGPIGGKLLASTVEFARKRPDWNVKIRPHPSENDINVKRELYLLDSTVAKKIEISSAESLAEASNQASVVLGVNSTALLEALLAGCRVAILRLSESASYFQPLINSGNAQIVLSGKDLADRIDDLPIGSARNYFSDPVTDIFPLVEA